MRRKGLEALRQGVREACIKGYGGVIYAFEGAQTVFARAIGDGVVSAPARSNSFKLSTETCIGLFLPE